MPNQAQIAAIQRCVDGKMVKKGRNIARREVLVMLWENGFKISLQG